MTTAPLVLATDLDGTFAAGTAVDARLLRELLEARQATLIYSTGRTVDSARGLVQHAGLPVPRILIADVGTSVVHGLGPRRVETVEQEIGVRWPGKAAVHACLGQIPGLEVQDIDAPRRVSYWIADNRALRLGSYGREDYEARRPTDPSLTEGAEQVAFSVAARAAAALHTLDVDVVVSGNVYLDVLPRGINKGSTLLRVLEHLGMAGSQCIVAGDSLNDRSLFEIGAQGIVVGNCEPALRVAVAGRRRVYCAQREGAAGILEGLRHFGALPPATEFEQGHAHAE